VTLRDHADACEARLDLARQAARPVHHVIHVHNGVAGGRCHGGQAQPKIPVLGLLQPLVEAAGRAQQGGSRHHSAGAHDVLGIDGRQRVAEQEGCWLGMAAPEARPPGETGSLCLAGFRHVHVVRKGKADFRAGGVQPELGGEFAGAPAVVGVKESHQRRADRGQGKVARCGRAPPGAVDMHDAQVCQRKAVKPCGGSV